MSKLCYVLALLYVLNPSKSAGSSDSLRSVLSIGLHGHVGFVFLHSKSLKDLGRLYPVGIQGEVAWQFTKLKHWNYCKCYPKAGVAVTYWNNGQPDILGHGITAVGFMEPVFFNNSNINFSIRMAMGSSYQSAPYDSIVNPDNYAYSTHIGLALVLHFNLTFKLSPHWKIRAFTGFNHISNAGIKEPNKGLNVPSVGLGVDYVPKPMNLPDRSNLSRMAPERKNRWEFTYFMANNNAYANDPTPYPIYGFMVKYSRYVGGVSALTLGTDFTVDMSMKERIQNDQDRDYKHGSILVGHEFWLSKLIFFQQIGIYYYDKYKQEAPFFHKWGISFNFTPRFLLGFALKAHYHVAEYFDVRVGLSF